MTITAAHIETAGRIAMRGALVLFFVGFGLYKFTPEEAAAIQPLMAASPFFSWLYSLLSVQNASNVIGIYEVAAAGLLLARPWSPRAALVGSVMIFVALLGTLSFLFTTPAAGEDLQGFIMKDIGLLAIALWSAGEAWGSVAKASRPALAAA